MTVTDDISSFETVVMPHLSDALTLARWLTRNSNDAEDVVQEACLRAFRSIATYQGGNARAWLLAIVRNTAYSWLQRQRETVAISSDVLETTDGAPLDRHDGHGASDETPETVLLAKADRAALRAAIEGLPLEFREALILREIHDLKYREIAQVVGVPLGTVMSRLSRARQLLAAALGSCSPER
jgi:RNA polymerase sigma factor (sigma-70 family)